MKILIASLLVFLAAPALADTPLPPPERQTVCSASGKVCATSDPATGITQVKAQGARQAPWTIPGWHRWIIVSNDGASVVIGHPGLNLVPANATLELPVLHFYNKGRLVRTVTLGDLYTRTSQLQRTVSHYAWVNSAAINAANLLVVELIDGKRIAFAMDTGRVQALPAPD